MFFKSNEKDPIKTISKLTEAYQVFLAILAEKYPHEIENLMLYTQTVQKLLSHVGTKPLSSTTKIFVVRGRKTQLHVLGNNKMQSFIRMHWSFESNSPFAPPPPLSIDTVMQTTTMAPAPKNMHAPILKFVKSVQANTTPPPIKKQDYYPNRTYRFSALFRRVWSNIVHSIVRRF